MKNRVLAALPLIGALAIASQAQAVEFTLGGDGNVTASGTLTVGPDPFADTMGIFGTPANLTTLSVPPPNQQGLVDPSNALAVTGVMGQFSDAALGIVNQTILGLIATTPQPHYDPDYTIPYSFGWYPGIPATAISYDNLYYPDAGAPITCLGVPPGGSLDDYGVMFTVTADGINPDAVVDMYSNGGAAAGDYGAVVWAIGPLGLDPGGPNYDSAGGLSFATPEPSTWVMMVLGFAGLGVAGYRSSRKIASVAA